MFEEKYSVTVIVDKKDGNNPISQSYEMYSYSFETVEKLLELIDILEGAEG
jgi:hypothetical protein